MGKAAKSDVDDVLGEDTAPAKKTKAKAPAVEAAPAKKASKKAAPADEDTPVKVKPAKEPVVFEEGEREELVKRIKKLVKKDINSRDLAVKLEISTRKLRHVLYSMQKREEIVLTPGESRVTGMTVSPA